MSSTNISEQQHNEVAEFCKMRIKTPAKNAGIRSVARDHNISNNLSETDVFIIERKITSSRKYISKPGENDLFIQEAPDKLYNSFIRIAAIVGFLVSMALLYLKVKEIFVIK